MTKPQRQTMIFPDEVKDMEGIEGLLAQFPTHQAQRHLLIFDATASLM